MTSSNVIDSQLYSIPCPIVYTVAGIVSLDICVPLNAKSGSSLIELLSDIFMHFSSFTLIEYATFYISTGFAIYFGQMYFTTTSDLTLLLNVYVLPSPKSMLHVLPLIFSLNSIMSSFFALNVNFVEEVFIST